METIKHTSEYHEKYEREHGEACPDCREWENHELRYPFGETPEDVIAERWREHVLIHHDSAFMEWVGFPNCTDLLTVLDALKVAAKVPFLRAPNNRFDTEVARADWSRRTDAKSLRISILAALGVDES